MTTASDLRPPPAHEPARRSGSIVLVLLVAGAIVAAAVAFMTLGRAQAQPYILGLLALLAMVGLFNLFAFAAGIIRFADRIADDPIMRPIADHAFDGLARSLAAALWVDVTDRPRAYNYLLFAEPVDPATGFPDTTGEKMIRIRVIPRPP